ncbi:MAG: hypothetical protein U1E50_11475 [Caulobacteraceae bacterium]
MIDYYRQQAAICRRSAAAMTVGEHQRGMLLLARDFDRDAVRTELWVRTHRPGHATPPYS